MLRFLGEGNYDYSRFLGFFRSFPYIITLETVELTTDPKPVLKGFENFKKMLYNHNESSEGQWDEML